MQKRVLGSARKEIPIVGQGTWQMEGDDAAACIAALRRGLDLGLTHVDTAEMYGRGAVEELVGKAIRGRRDDVFLVSKVLPSNASRAGTALACEKSLARLGTGHLDLYLLHWPGKHPLEETIRAFEDLQEAGKIRAWGVSNFDVADLEGALRIAGPDRIACNQVLYHLEERTIEHAVVPWCASHGVAVVAYSPFGSGRFPGARTSGGKVLHDVAEAHGVSPHAVALAFLVREPHAFAIPKASTQEHVEANAAAGTLRLTSADIARIDAAFPRGKDRGLRTL